MGWLDDAFDAVGDAVGDVVEGAVDVVQDVVEGAGNIAGSVGGALMPIAPGLGLGLKTIDWATDLASGASETIETLSGGGDGSAKPADVQSSLTAGIVERHEDSQHDRPVRDHRGERPSGNPKPDGEGGFSIGDGPFWRGPLIVKPDCGWPSLPERGCDDGGSVGGGGASIFEQIAIAMGQAMDNKLDQLLEAANEVSNLSGQGAEGAEGAGKTGESGGKPDPSKVLEASALVTARGQELNAMSQAFNSSINSVGQAASNAARKT